MRKKLLIAIISAIVIIALIVIFFPKQECGNWPSIVSTETSCACIGIKTHDNMLAGSSSRFCKGVCLKSTCKEIVPPTYPKASSENPLALESNEVNILQGNTTRIKITAYNDGSFELKPVRLFFQQCVSEAGENTDLIKLLASSQSISKGRTGVWNAVISVNQTVSKGKYVCEVRAFDENYYFSQSLLVTVV